MNAQTPAWRRAQRQNSMPGQHEPYDPSAQKDVWILQQIRERAHRFGVPLQDYIDRLAGAIQVRGIPTTMNSFSGTIQKVGTAQLVVDQNFNRLRLILSNPDTNANSLYFFYKNVPQAPITLAPGQTYTDDSENPIIDQVWITQLAGPAQQFTALEGQPSI